MGEWRGRGSGLHGSMGCHSPRCVDSAARRIGHAARRPAAQQSIELRRVKPENAHVRQAAAAARVPAGQARRGIAGVGWERLCRGHWGHGEGVNYGTAAAFSLLQLCPAQRCWPTLPDRLQTLPVGTRAKLLLLIACIPTSDALPPSHSLSPPIASLLARKAAALPPTPPPTTTHTHITPPPS